MKTSEELKPYLPAANEGCAAVPKDPNKKLLIEIIQRMDDLFVEDGVSKNDMFNHVDTILLVRSLKTKWRCINSAATSKIKE